MQVCKILLGCNFAQYLGCVIQYRL